MDDTKRIEIVEDELKLMKGEVKQTLVSVRDYLLNMELPSSEFATVLAALGSDGEQKITMKGTFEQPKNTNPPPPAEEELKEDELPAEEFSQEEEAFEPEAESPPEEEPFMSEPDYPSDEEILSPESEMPSEDTEDNLSQTNAAQPTEEFEMEPPAELEEPYTENEPFMPTAGLPIEEEKQMERDNICVELYQSTPRVNLLANLMHWVSKAKKEIGADNLTTFLEVYGLSGHLSPELKDTILNLAEIASVQPDELKSAELWSQSMLSLHGILTGGDAPLHPVAPFWDNGNNSNQDNPDLYEEDALETEPEKPKEAPVKLKLVFPNGDGKGKEFCINLNPEENSQDYERHKEEFPRKGVIYHGK